MKPTLFTFALAATLVAHAPYTCSKETLPAAKAMADKFGAPPLIQLSETRDEQKQIQEKYGMSPTRWLDWISFLGPNVLADVSPTNARVGLTPRCSGLATLAAEIESLDVANAVDSNLPAPRRLK